MYAKAIMLVYKLMVTSLSGQFENLTISGEIHFFRWGEQSLLNYRKTFKFPTTPPPFALEKAVFGPLLGQNFRKFVIFHEGGRASPSAPLPPLPDISYTYTVICKR
jgi:hypothetical protein